MKRFLLLTILALVGAIPLYSQTDALQGHCTLGGTKSITSGLNSTNYNQGVIPGCTVTVYLTGTTTLATIYSNSTGTVLANPFTAVQLPSPNAGYWIFYAATGVGYDVKLSGGNGNPSCTTAPNCYTTPLTYTDLKVGGGGGGSGLTFFSAGNLPPVFTTSVTNPGTTPNLAFNLTSQNGQTVFGNFTGASAPPFYAQYACTGLLTCNFSSGTNTWTLDVPNTSTLSVTATTPILVNGGAGPVSSGTANISCPTCGQAALQMQVIPPIAGQYTIIYPTTGTITSDPVGAASIFANGSTAAGGHFQWQCSGALCSVAGSNQANWSGFALPSWLAARTGDITAIYADVITSAGPVGYDWGYTDVYSHTSLLCNGNQMLISPTAYPYTSQEKSALTGLTGATFDSTASCTIQVGGSGPGGVHGQQVNVSAVRFIVYYSGAPGPASPDTLNIQPPLSWAEGTNTLFLDGNDLGAIHLTGIKIALLPPASGVNQRVYLVADGSSSSDCLTGGGSDAHYCYSNGSSWNALGGGGGGSGTVTNIATGTGLTGGPITTTGTISCVDSTSSTKGCVQVDGTTITATGGVISAPGGGGGLSGQTPNYLPKATTATTSTGPSIVEDQGTGVVIHGTAPTNAMFFPTVVGTPTPVATDAGFGSDSSGNAVASDNGGVFSRVCTAANGVCAGSGVSVGFAIGNGTPATPAVPLILAPVSGTISHCYFTTNSSDGATALTFNVKFNGTDIISGTNATVAAGTTQGTVSTFTLTSGTIAITSGQKWEIDISSGTSSWSGIAQCF